MWQPDTSFRYVKIAFTAKTIIAMFYEAMV